MFTAVGSDKMEVNDQNVQTNSLEMKHQNTQTEIVQIDDQPVQAESTTQQQGSLIVHNTFSSKHQYMKFFEEQESMTCTNVTLL